jgi:hypothetical protein
MLNKQTNVVKVMLVLCHASVLSACISGLQELEQLQDYMGNRALWNSHNISSYQYEYMRNCFCSATFPVTVTVTDNQVTVPADAAHIPTIDQLFDKIQEVLLAQFGTVDIVYDTQYGFPAEISIDRVAMSVDDEHTITVTNFVPQL